MRFQLGAQILTFENGADYPANRPYELTQVIDRTAGGSLQVEDLGIDIERRELSFSLMSKTDHDSLKVWFYSIAQGAKNTFEFEDEVGRIGNVKIITPIFNFTEDSYQRYSGNLVLEYV